LNLHGK